LEAPIAVAVDRIPVAIVIADGGTTVTAGEIELCLCDGLEFIAGILTNFTSPLVALVSATVHQRGEREDGREARPIHVTGQN
jgi:hypothetical protein